MPEYYVQAIKYVSLGADAAVDLLDAIENITNFLEKFCISCQ